MGFALRHLPNYSYEDYKLWEGKWELISGFPYAMAPAPAFIHQRISGKIFSQFEEKLSGCKNCTVVLPVDWVIDENTVVQPDVLVVCGHDGKAVVTKIPSIVIEILSPSTAHKDKTVKLELYEFKQVPYYIIVNPDNNTAEIYVLKDGKYILPPVYVTKESYEFSFNNCKIDFEFSNIW